MRTRTKGKIPLTDDDFIGPMEPHVILCLPFPGFYNSILSADIDAEENEEAEHMEDKERGGFQGKEYPETKQPKHRRLTRDEFSELLIRHADYGGMELAIAKVWVEAFDQVYDEETGIHMRLKFESMDSPSEYNFHTDRLFAYIPHRSMCKVVRYALRSKSSRDALRKCIIDRHQSRSGFASWYSTDLTEWAANIRKFMRGETDALDHNQLRTILESTITNEDFEWSVYYTYSEDCTVYNAHQQNVDWAKLDEEAEELRQEKDIAWQEANPGQPLPAMLDNLTKDMLRG